MKLKKGFIIILTILGFVLIASKSVQASNYKTHYTNPLSLRSHKYWYGYSNSYTGKWGYERIHFAKHSVYFAEKTYKNNRWKKSHIQAKHYFIQKLKSHGWYTFGPQATEDVTIVKIDHRYLGNTKHVVLSIFDISNDNGGYQEHAPYKVWDYTTHLKWAKGWYHEINKAPR